MRVAHQEQRRHVPHCKREAQDAVASIVGRGIIFYGIGALLWVFGAPVRRVIDRYFNTISIVGGVLLIAIIVLFKKFL